MVQYNIVNESAGKYLNSIDDETYDLVVTSPPYCKIRESAIYKADFPFQKIAIELVRTLKNGGVICWNVGDQTINGSETGTPFRQTLFFMDFLGMNLWDTMIFAKNSFSFPSRRRYHQTWEYIFVLSKGKPKTFNPIKDRKNKYKGVRGASGRDKNGTRRKGTSIVRNEWGMRFNIWEYKIGLHHSARKDPWAHVHPAIMHHKLAYDLIISWSNESDLVLDPFCGGSTTGIECIYTNRSFIGIDLSEEYCELSERRLAWHKEKIVCKI